MSENVEFIVVATIQAGVYPAIAINRIAEAR
jgi:hypothetical protein